MEKRIAIDLDGTIFDNSEIYVQLVGHMIYGDEFDISSIPSKEYDLCKIFKIDQTEANMYGSMVLDEFYWQSLPYPNAVGSLRILKDDGWEITILTSRDARLESCYTAKQLSQYCIPFDNLIFAGKSRRRSKAEIVQDLGIQLIVEDSPYEIESLINIGREILVKKHDYNEDLEYGPGIVMFDNWKQLCNLLVGNKKYVTYA